MGSAARRGFGAVVASLVLGILVPGIPVVAASSPPLAARDEIGGLPLTAPGIDVSFPQCASASHVELPGSVPFAIVGVNGGRASDSNRCFVSEYNSALLLSGLTEQPHAAVYINTGNPALAGTWWPKSNRTQAGSTVRNPDGTCKHKAGAACAYVYGYSMAQADYRRVQQTWRPAHKWWLDVETTNTWQADVAANSASLVGMVDYLEGKGIEVGIYSTSYQWNTIAGVTSPTSDLAGLDSWLAGGSRIAAGGDCEKPPLTPNGRVVMVQFVSTLDEDFSCQLFAHPNATVAPTGPVGTGSILTASTAQWAPGDVSYTYQWMRNGQAIKGATGRSYVTTKQDLDTLVAITVTGRMSGYSTTAVNSAPVAVLDTMNPAPIIISGTPTSGQLLTVLSGPWSPASASFDYAWYRNNVLVSSGTSATSYFLTSADVGAVISVTVTASDPGFVPASESASTTAIQP